MKKHAWQLGLIASVALTMRWLSARPLLSQSYRPAPDYLVTISVEPPIREIEIQHYGQRVYWRRLRCFCLYLGEQRCENQHIARDANGDGIPDLVVQEYLGQAAFITRVLQLGEQFRELASLDSIAPPSFTRDANGFLIAWTREEIWRGWRVDSRSLASPGIALRLRGPRFEPGLDLMKRPASTSSEEALDSAMTRLLYAGHPDLCLQALRRSELTPLQQRQYLSDFRARLKTSKWAASLAAGLPSS